MSTVVAELRRAERRVDKRTSKILQRALAIQRAFGSATASNLLCNAGMSAANATALLEIGKERRCARRRFR